MAFDVTTYGSNGDEKIAYTTKITSLGASMELPDGRKFRFARLGAAAAVAGYLYQGVSAANANTVMAGGAITAVPSAAAVGAVSLTVTVAGSASAASTALLLADGYLVIASSAGAGIGYNYKIKNVTVNAAGSAYTVNLDPNDAIKVALEAGTTKVQLIPHSHSGALLCTADTVGVSAILGVACATAAASTYVWLQTRGTATVQADATTIIIGMPVVAASAVAGAVGVPPAAGSAATSVIKQTFVVGHALLGSGSTTNFIPVRLCIE